MFTVRIEIQGLFRIFPHPPDNPQRVFAVAPWVEPETPAPGTPASETRAPEAPAESPHEAACPHDFVVQWKPWQLGYPMPPDAVTMWRLEGKRLSFDFEGGTPRGLVVNLDELDIPCIYPPEGKEGIFSHDEEEARIKADAWKDPGEFKRDKDENQFDLRPNKEGVMGQILIDRGHLVTDDIEAIMTEFEGRQEGQPKYRGRFTNRLALVVNHVDAFKLIVEDLVDGGPKGELPMRPSGDSLVIRVKHICPQFLIRDRPPVPSEDGTFEDRDFRYLYNLCENPAALGENLPIPVRKDDRHSSPRWECGSAVS